MIGYTSSTAFVCQLWSLSMMVMALQLKRVIRINLPNKSKLSLYKLQLLVSL